jgi:hypothetical protein
VIDYAANWAASCTAWITELVHAPGSHLPLRVVLLERQAQRAIGWLNPPPIIDLGGYRLPPNVRDARRDDDAVKLSAS